MHVAHVVDPSEFEGNAIGFENHLNVFHSRKKGINATDIRLLRYPDIKELKELGHWLQMQDRPTQESIVRSNGTATGRSRRWMPKEDKIADAQRILGELGMPMARRNDRSALCLLALVNLTFDRRQILA